MTIDEFEPENELLEISRKLSNVSIHLPSYGETIEKDSFPTIKNMLFSIDPNQIRHSARLVRKYLTQVGCSNEEKVNDILSLDVLPRIKDLLCANIENSIKLECTWIVTNITAGTTEQTNAIINSGFPDILLTCISDKSTGFDVKSQAAWALGNIAGDSAANREALIRKGFIVAVVEVLNTMYDELHLELLSTQTQQEKLQFFENERYAEIETFLWTLSNMARGGFCVAEYYQHYLLMFDVLSKYIGLDYLKLEIEVCWGLSRILYNMHEVDEFHQQNHISENLCERLAYILRNGVPKVVVPAIRTIVNITSGPNHNITGLIRTPLLASITRLLEPQAPYEIRKDAYLVISNLAAGTEDMIQHVIEHRIVMMNVVAHITVPGHTYTHNPVVWTPTISYAFYHKNEEWKVTKEALWIIFNIISLGHDATVSELLKEHRNLPQALAMILNYIDLPLEVCEKAIETIICLIQRTNKWIAQRYVQGENPYVRIMIQYNIHTILPLLPQIHQTAELRDLSLKLDKLLVLDESMMLDTCVPFTVDIKLKGNNKRRVLRGLEDGDVRLIENSVRSLCIL